MKTYSLLTGWMIYIDISASDMSMLDYFELTFQIDKRLHEIEREACVQRAFERLNE